MKIGKHEFEDENEDVEWEILLPIMSKTSCKNIVFIVGDVHVDKRILEVF
jgi:hypothetical protein